MASSLTCTLVIMLSSVFDFWITKNISGRLLVGLRWWSQDGKTGKSRWIFESRKDETKANKTDKVFFWGPQVVASAIWLFFAFLNLISFDIFWFTVTGYCLVMSGTNLYAYYQCSKGIYFITCLRLTTFPRTTESTNWIHERYRKKDRTKCPPRSFKQFMITHNHHLY